MVAFDASGSALLGVADRDELRVWSLPTTTGAAPAFSVPSQGPLILADFVAPERVVTVTAIGNFSEWNWALRETGFSHKLYGGGELATFSSDRHYLALGGALWDRSEERDLPTLRVREQTALEFSIDGYRVAVNVLVYAMTH